MYQLNRLTDLKLSSIFVLVFNYSLSTIRQRVVELFTSTSNKHSSPQLKAFECFLLDIILFSLLFSLSLSFFHFLFLSVCLSVSLSLNFNLHFCHSKFLTSICGCIFPTFSCFYHYVFSFLMHSQTLSLCHFHLSLSPSLFYMESKYFI